MDRWGLVRAGAGSATLAALTKPDQRLSGVPPCLAVAGSIARPPDLSALIPAAAGRLAGFAAENSHSSKNASRSSPERRSASAMNSGTVALPPARRRNQRFSRPKNVSSPIRRRSACRVAAPRS